MHFWIFCTWQRSGRPCRRLFDGAIATQLKQATHFMGQWNTRPTSSFIVLSFTNMQIIWFTKLSWSRLESMICPHVSTFTDLEKTQIKIANSDAGHLVMSMRQGRGGDLCNRGDPPSNMTCHRYQPSPNIKWTRLPFSHKMCHKSFPKPPSRLCLCVSERSSWFWEADERQFVQTRAPREAEGRWWLPLVNGPGNLKWALSSWKQRSCHTTWEWCENQRRKEPT